MLVGDVVAVMIVEALDVAVDVVPVVVDVGAEVTDVFTAVM